MNRILSVLVVIILIIACASPVFADPIALTGAEIFSALFASYLASRGVSIVVSDNYTATSPTNPIPNSTYVNMFNLIYDTVNGRLPVADQKTIDEWADWAETKVSTNVAPAGNLSPTNTTFMLTDDLVEWFDRITTDLFTTDLGLMSDSGVYHTSGNFFDNTLVSISTTGAFTLPVTTNNASDIKSNGVVIGHSTDGTKLYFSGATYADVMVGTYPGQSYFFDIAFKTTTPNVTVYVVKGSDSDYVRSYPLNSQSDGWYYANVTYNNRSDVPDVPSYSDLSEFLGAVPAAASNTRIQLRPEDKYNEKLKDKDGQVLSPGDVYIPDVTDEIYVPDAIPGTWDIPYNPEYVNDITKALADVAELVKVNKNVLEVVDDNPDPVIAPYVPFTNIPSFNFDFSGIWHYVTSWVSSLGSGLGFISSIWSNIPYAMVVPVYAAVVVVIVTSIFKRFV